MNDQAGADVEGLYLERQFELKWRVGARTAAHITQLASRFESRIQIAHAGLTVSARSMMSVMLLDLVAGSQINVRASGPDAAAAMRAFAKILTCGSRQERCPHDGCPSTPIFLDCGERWVAYGCSKWHFWWITGQAGSLIQLGLKPWERPSITLSLN